MEAKTIRAVLQKYSERVPFPWSIDKLQQAGCNTEAMLDAIAAELATCDDADNPLCQELLSELEIAARH